jgi:hypothetical protein
MSYSNGKITAPISISDVANALGSGSYDLGTLCNHDNINPASRNKPIVYPTVAALTDEQRQGTDSDKNDGYYYGVKCIYRKDVIKSLTFLHDCNYSYKKPTGGTAAPFRLTDFEDYYHNAQFSPQFSASELTAFIDVAYGFQFTITYQQGNTMGIDIAEILKDEDAQNSKTALQMMQSQYPCILISDGTKTNCWVCALSYMNNASGSYSQGTLCAGTTETSAWRTSWAANFKGETSLLSFINSASTLRVTIFFVDAIKTDTYDFTSWTNITATDKVYSARMITCPNGVDLAVKFKEFASKGATLNFAVSGTNVNVSFVFAQNAPTGKYNYTAQIYDTTSGGRISIGGSFTCMGAGSSGFTSVDISKDLLNGYANGTKLTISWTVENENDNTVKNSGSQSVIATNS